MTKQTVKALAVGRSDTFKLKPSDIFVVPGFNTRIMDDETREHVAQLKEMIRENGVLEPLTVAYNEAEDRTELRHGHCRLMAVNELIAEGAEIKWLPAQTERRRASETDAIVEIVLRNDGKPLRPIERAAVYKRLSNFGWTDAAIAKKVGRSAAHVSQMLQLLAAPETVQQAVRSGEVSASLASQTIREHGSDAPAVIEEAVQSAKREGKKRATARHIDSGPRRTKENFEICIDALQAISEGRGLGSRSRQTGAEGIGAGPGAAERCVSCVGRGKARSMTEHQSKLKAFASRAKPIMERQMDDADDMRELMKEMREIGLQGAVMKKWLKAEIQYDRTGDDRALKKLKTDTEDAALYGAVLGHEVDGFGLATKDFVVNDSSPPTGQLAQDDRAGTAGEGSSPTFDVPPEPDDGHDGASPAKESPARKPLQGGAGTAEQGEDAYPGVESDGTPLPSRPCSADEQNAPGAPNRDVSAGDKPCQEDVAAGNPPLVREASASAQTGEPTRHGGRHERAGVDAASASTPARPDSHIPTFMRRSSSDCLLNDGAGE